MSAKEDRSVRDDEDIMVRIEKIENKLSEWIESAKLAMKAMRNLTIVIAVGMASNAIVMLVGIVLITSHLSSLHSVSPDVSADGNTINLSMPSKVRTSQRTYFVAEEVAEIEGVGVTTVQDWCRSGKIPHQYWHQDKPGMPYRIDTNYQIGGTEALVKR